MIAHLTNATLGSKDEKYNVDIIQKIHFKTH